MLTHVLAQDLKATMKSGSRSARMSFQATMNDSCTASLARSGSRRMRLATPFSRGADTRTSCVKASASPRLARSTKSLCIDVTATSQRWSLRSYTVGNPGVVFLSRNLLAAGEVPAIRGC
jgi:hypothetical protein